MAGNYKKFGVLLGSIAAMAVLAGAAPAAHKTHKTARQHKNAPGVSKHQITIGGTFPLTGPASLYKTVPAAEQAYYAYVDANGGVNGRMIKDIVLDDAYNPAQTVPQTQKLVEHYHVFADVGSLGTAPGLATWGYLNQHQVPQVLLATGDSYWGNCVHHPCSGGRKTWTMGWQADYPGEAKLYAKYIISHNPNAKIGVLFQDDAYGKNLLGALRTGLGSHVNQIVDAEGANATDSAQVVGAHVISLAQHGADTFLIFGTPPISIPALAYEGQIPGWTPVTFVNFVGADRIFMLLAAQSGAKLDGVISTTFLASPTTQANLKGMKLAKKIIDATGNQQLIQSFNAGDGNIPYGLGTAWTFVYALKHAGKNPTRKSLMYALRHMNTNKNPFLYPGTKIQTSSKRTFPIEQMIFMKWSGGAGGDWHTFGKIRQSGH
jgi:branched-chain amino acid transport system substrate-binding protein